VSKRGGVATWTLAATFVAGSVGAGDLVMPARTRPFPRVVAPRASPPPALRLVWLDVTGTARGVDEMARAEARSILERSGLDVIWRGGKVGELARPGEILVILLARGAVYRSSGRPVLGATPSDRRSAAHVWIHVGSVRAAIGLGSEPAAMALRARARRNLGVALGRVVAHEVVHAVAPSVAHRGELMAERLSRRDLTASAISLEPRTALAVRSAVLGLADPPRSRLGVQAANRETESSEVGGPTPRQTGVR
jgi:hypothetical protein